MAKALFWYFSADDKRLRYDDGRLIRRGVTHKVDCEPVLCQSGLHASKRAIDALRYAPGSVIWRVTLGGAVVHGDDKSCATERTYVAGGVNVEAALRLFARQCALDVVHLWDAPRVVLDFLNTGDETLRVAAGDAARAATSGAVAARAAAWAAVGRHALGAAAWAAVGRHAARAATTAAGDAAWDAAGDAQNKRLTKLLLAAIREAE